MGLSLVFKANYLLDQGGEFADAAALLAEDLLSVCLITSV